MTQDYVSSKRNPRHAPKDGKEFTGQLPGKKVGWICRAWGVAWVVSPHRSDKRTGATNPVPFGEYAQELYEAVSIGKGPGVVPTRPAPIADQEAAEAQLRTYWLHYESRSDGGKGKHAQPLYEKIEAETDGEAWRKANGFLDYIGASSTVKQQASLFEREREVRRPYEPPAT